MTVPKIMVCDDDRDILEMLEAALEINGFEVITEYSSVNVIDEIEKYNPDVLLIDLWMPIITGDEVIRKLRAEPDKNAIPVVAISASNDGEAVALDAGADYFVAKPFNIKVLVECLNRAARKRGSSQVV